MTDGYRNWFEIGAALANVMGEEGGEYFHALSQFHPGYSPKEADRLFDGCLKHRYCYGVGTLVHALGK